MKTRPPTLAWLRALTSLISPKKVRRKKTIQIPHDPHHNLKDLFNEVNLTYFEGSIDLRVEWSGNGQTESRSSVRLGYYNPRKELIKISRLLDYPEVPKYFVCFILYHEILHHVLPPEQMIGFKRKIHHRAFKQKEKEFQEYKESQAFLKDFKKTLFSPKKLKRTPECKTL